MDYDESRRQPYISNPLAARVFSEHLVKTLPLQAILELERRRKLVQNLKAKIAEI